ncbi:hypothetical protein AB0M45_25610 [Nocardia sp. NPDC051787]|uniref:hypothetical protein n=1 Tax=Nocardia sp. NPDC051787 TaxID=3155415 RepID=UPI00341DA65C
MSTRRKRSPLNAIAMDGENARRIFIQEYTFLREGNMSHEAIARRLGLSLATLQTRIMRYDCLVLSETEQRVSDRIDELITAGEPFTLEQVTSLDDGTAQLLVNIALKRGRVKSSQSRTSRPKRPSVYTPVRSDP